MLATGADPLVYTYEINEDVMTASRAMQVLAPVVAARLTELKKAA